MTLQLGRYAITINTLEVTILISNSTGFLPILLGLTVTSFVGKQLGSFGGNYSIANIDRIGCDVDPYYVVQSRIRSLVYYLTYSFC